MAAPFSQSENTCSIVVWISLRLLPSRRTASLLSERRDDFPRAVDPDGRPQDRQIEACVSVFSEALAAAQHRPQQADCVEQAIAQSLAAATLLRLIGLCVKPLARIKR